jgi:nicotinate-nucleotide pyrophosphorylase (carboxylating)
VPDPAVVERLVRAALDEDSRGGADLTTEATVPAGRSASGVLLAKQALVVAGLDVARSAFTLLDPAAVWRAVVPEGASVSPQSVLVGVEGQARALLTAERVALNFLQRLSGVATITRRFADAVAGTTARIRDTRKTTPLLRALEKHAVAVGGGVPHRSGLATGILVKDNHVRLAGSVGEATRRAVAAAPKGLVVEIEVEYLDQVEEALVAGAGMLLLDNFRPEDVRKAVSIVGGRVPVEVSGGVTLETVRAFAEAGPDFIAVGAITHSAPAVDISFELDGEVRPSVAG